MYAAGHIGIALLVFAPLGAFLLATGRSRLAVSGAVLSVAVATLPDLDLFVAALPHRGFTHTLAFAVLAGAVLGAVASVAMTRRLPRLSAGRVGLWVWFTTTLSMCSHLLGDALTPMGIRPLAPVADSFVSLSLVYSRNPQVNLSLLLAGGVTTAAYWWHGIGADGRATARRSVRTALYSLRVVFSAPRPASLSVPSALRSLHAVLTAPRSALRSLHVALTGPRPAFRSVPSALHLLHVALAAPRSALRLLHSARPAPPIALPSLHAVLSTLHAVRRSLHPALPSLRDIVTGRLPLAEMLSRLGVGPRR